MSKPVKISTVLTRAAKHIEEYGLAKGAFFKARNGRQLVLNAAERKARAAGELDEFGALVAKAQEKGCRACALGAIYIGIGASSFSEREPLFNVASRYADNAMGRWPSYWNDEPDRTQDEVVQALKDAAKAARKDGK